MEQFTNRESPSYGPGGGRFPWGLYINPGARVVAYVKSAGGSPSQEKELGGVPLIRTAAEFAQVLAYCRPGFGDVIGILPGSSLTVTDATMFNNLKAGTRIIGIGDPSQSNAPTFRWTATAAEWNIDVADVTIAGLRLQMEGANGVVLPIDVNAAGFCLKDCYIETASGATAKATQILDVSLASHDFCFCDNWVHGTETHNSTNGITMPGANLRAQICNNKVIASFTAANGFLNITGASKRTLILNNKIYNTHTASTACIQINNAAADGFMDQNYTGVINTAGTASAQGIVVTAGLFRGGFNFCSDTAALNGLLSPVASA